MSVNAEIQLGWEVFSKYKKAYLRAINGTSKNVLIIIKAALYLEI